MRELYKHIQIFVYQQTNISIEDIFEQIFRYCKVGERTDYGCTGCVVQKADQSAWPLLPIRFAGTTSSDENDGSSTMLNPDLFLGK